MAGWEAAKFWPRRVRPWWDVDATVYVERIGVEEWIDVTGPAAIRY